MRKTIIETIKRVGLNINDFKIADNGADNSLSIIRYNPYGGKNYKDLPEKYFIQYSDTVVAIWEVEKRIKTHASLDVNMGGILWKDVNVLHIKDTGIQGTDESTKGAAMPIESLESYLRLISNVEEKDDYYINRLEGTKAQIFSTRYERKPDLRAKAIEIHGTSCKACGFSFEEKYGDIGKNYIEVHHIKPISEGVRNTNPETDMVCLCSNCHRMVHHGIKDRVLTVDELKMMISKQLLNKE